jgi:pSer/pThr/pTyr-binding forkhead associated (FHA) protein
MFTQPMDQFWEACGAKAPLKISVRRRGNRRTSRFRFEQPFMVVGRNRQNDLVLDSEQISKRHAYLQVIAGRIYCVDLHSRTGVHWKTGPQRAGWLDFESVIRIGPYFLHPLPPPADAEPVAAAPTVACLPSLPAVNVEFALDGSYKGNWNMRGVVILVGGSPDCGVQLIDPSVSRYHCSFVRTSHGVWVVDLLGRGGICVNGFAVRSARLKDGDELQVGRFQLRFYQASETKLPIALPLGSQRTILPATTVPWNDASDSEPSMLLAAPSPGPADAMLVPLPSPTEVKLLADTIGSGDLSTTSLAPLIQQFGMLHQQMFGQFQQAMLSLVQMLTSVQGEQLSLIREEMQHLHRLTDELEKLHTEAQQTSRVAAPPRKNGSAAPSRKPPASPPETGPAGPPVATAPVPQAPEASAEADTNMHAWITQRIAAIQEEQQSSWQRIVQFVVGRRAEDPAL